MADIVTCKIFEGLVKRFGGVEAVASLLEARYGAGSKGTVSKMCAGQLAVTVDAAIAVEDALQCYPITDRLSDRPESSSRFPVRVATLPELAAESILETSEAVGVILKAFSPSSADPTCLTDEERGSALKELGEARAVLDQMIKTIEAGAA